MSHVPVVFISPASEPTGRDGRAVVRSFKQLRDFMEKNEAHVCNRCPLQDQCADKFKIPNAKYNAGVRDVFQVLLAYADKADDLDRLAPQDISEDQLADDQALSPEQTEAASQYRHYGLKMKDALIVLQALETLVDSKLEDESFLPEKFSAAIAEYENGAHIDKYSVDQTDRKAGRFRRQSNEQSLVKPEEDDRAVRRQESDLKLRNSFPGTLPKGELSEKQRTYLRKFDDNVSDKPIPDSGSRQLPKKKQKGGESYVDSIKKQASSTVAGHFLKDFKKPLGQRTSYVDRTDSRFEAPRTERRPNFENSTRERGYERPRKDGFEDRSDRRPPRRDDYQSRSEERAPRSRQHPRREERNDDDEPEFQTSSPIREYHKKGAGAYEERTDRRGPKRDNYQSRSEDRAPWERKTQSRRQQFNEDDEPEFVNTRSSRDYPNKRNAAFEGKPQRREPRGEDYLARSEERPKRDYRDRPQDNRREQYEQEKRFQGRPERRLQEVEDQDDDTELESPNKRPSRGGRGRFQRK